ncbi:BglG family transcription antiterminator [Mesobacillus jeotgali]|uniref:BglG family transcription antiterminator n=1 Tax=Mesobacillus jeotgali TaxID=129985 RepID=UPI000C83E3AF|nr:transcription antiterminator [Mesobacillus jeotgali]
MTINKRKKEILSRLIRMDLYISMKTLTEELGVTRSTVYRDIKGINDWLEKHHLQPVQYARNKGFYLNPVEKASIKNKLGKLTLDPEYQLSAKERRAWIGVLLLTREKAVFLDNLLKKLNVSRSTILRDLEQLKARLLRHRLDLQKEKRHGYRIVGAEEDKRRSLVHFLARIHPVKESHWLSLEEQISEGTWTTELFASPEAAGVYRILIESEKYLDIHYPDDMMEILSVHLLFLLKRYRQGKTMHMDPMEKVILKPSEEYSAAKFIGNQIEKQFDLSIPDDELCYITVCLMGAKTEEYCPSSAGEAELALLKKIINKMVSDFEEDFHLAFRDRDVLERSLYFHLKSAYYRIIYGLEYDNPLAESIISNFPDLYKETKKVIHYLEEAMGKRISEDEVALIAMHFGGWIERPGA